MDAYSVSFLPMEIEYTHFFTHDIWTYLIYPQLDIPSLFAWRRVCCAAYNAVTRQDFWRKRLLVDNPTGQCTSSMRKEDLVALIGRFDMNRSRLAAILNVLFQRPPPAWYAAKRRGFLLHSSRERARVHRVAAVLGLYSRAFLSSDVHVYHRTVMTPGGGYETDPGIEGTTEFKAMEELGVTVYWNPEHIPPYAFAPRTVLVNKQRMWSSHASMVTFGQIKANVKADAVLRLAEQQDQGAVD